MGVFPVGNDGRFARWIVSSGFLKTDFTLIDVGVLGGISERWEHLRPRLAGVGFDLNPEGISTLKERDVSGKFTYHLCALGREDGSSIMFVRPHDYNNSLLFPDRVESIEEGGPSSNRVIVEERPIQVRSIDSIVRSGLCGRPDFIKIDTEGFEIEVLAGATGQIENDDLLGIESETCFLIRDLFPNTHLSHLLAAVVPRGFAVFDMRFIRGPKTTLPCGPLRIVDGELRGSEYGSFIECDILFLRDLVSTDPDRKSPTERVLKMAAVFELYDMLDCAIELVLHYRETLQPLFSVDMALDLLTPRLGTTEIPYRQYLQLAESMKAGVRFKVDTQTIITGLRPS